jgi:hypothetical protein
MAATNQSHNQPIVGLNRSNSDENNLMPLNDGTAIMCGGGGTMARPNE